MLSAGTPEFFADFSAKEPVKDSIVHLLSGMLRTQCEQVCGGLMHWVMLAVLFI